MSCSAVRYSHCRHAERHWSHTHNFPPHRLVHLKWHFREVWSFYNILFQWNWSARSIYYLNSFFLRTKPLFESSFMLKLSLSLFVFPRLLRQFILVPLTLKASFFSTILSLQMLCWSFLLIIIVIMLSLKLLLISFVTFWKISLIIKSTCFLSLYHLPHSI